MKALILNDMIWPEVEALKDQIEVVLVPVGSCEQHGPNTTFETDTARAYEFCKMLGERLGNAALIAPPVAYGLSTHHMNFPGTITLRGETYINLICDIAIALDKHGFKKVVFACGHGGNYTALDVALNKLKYEFGISSYYITTGGKIYDEAVQTEAWGWSKIKGHACEQETSQSMVLCPWVVRENRVKGEVNDPYEYREFQKYGCAYSRDWKSDVTQNGALGDARLASAEYGKIINDKALDNAEHLIEMIRRHKPVFPPKGE